MPNDNPYATHQELGLMQGFPPPPDQRVNKSNAVFVPPYHRWAYQNMRKILPSAGIPQSTTPRQLKIKPDDGIERLSVTRPDGSTASFHDYLTETFTDALVVVKGDEVVFESYMNGMHANQPHLMCSCTKSFAGLMALTEIEKGNLSEDDYPTRYIPQLASASAFADATIGQILDMTNSMSFNEDYDDPDSDITTYGKVAGFVESVAGEQLVADNVFDYACTLQKGEHEHGEMFAYQTPKTEVTNWLINTTTGRSFEENMTLLFDAIGAEGETYVVLDPNANVIAGGGLNATPHNLARFAMMMLNDGKVGTQQVVPVSVIENIERGGDQTAFLKGPDALGLMAEGGFSYRAQWWVRRTEGREYISAMGIFGQFIVIDRSRKIAIIKQSTQLDSYNPSSDDYNIAAFDAIRDWLTG